MIWGELQFITVRAKQVPINYELKNNVNRSMNLFRLEDILFSRTRVF